MEMRELVDKLNKYRNLYYNYNTSDISDKEYDELFDTLKKMEEETNTVFADSPTVSVGYSVQSNLEKVKHSHAMMSLDKTKDTADIESFAGSNKIIAMLKMDGLTCSIHYDETGNLISAETRGDGIIGENITENIKQVKNVPLKINNNGIPFTIDGEIIVTKDVFDLINQHLDKKFAHPRNYASGSIRQLDTKVTADRNLSFIAWKVVEGCSSNSMDESLQFAKTLGFTIVPKTLCFHVNDYKHIIAMLENIANIEFYPIDGIVFSYDDIDYGNSLGNTAHHPRHSLAYKFYNDEYETILRDIEWNPTRTGLVSPVAVFDPIDLDGALTSRATLHNVSYMKQLELGVGDTITVFRANEVIPKVARNLVRSNSYEYPTVCPCCGSKLELRKEGIAENLFCDNTTCEAKIIAKFVHFTNKNGINVEGLSEATIKTFYRIGLLTTFEDIFNLTSHEEEIVNMQGFGKRSFDKLIQSIEKAKQIKLENYINALGIPGVGYASAKTISKHCNGNYNTFYSMVKSTTDWTFLEDFGQVLSDSITEYCLNNIELINNLSQYFEFIKEESYDVSSEFIANKTFVITGSFSKPRKFYEDLITSNGGILAGSVSKKTNFLLTNDTTSGSSKNKKAAELNIPILTEKEFLEKL